MTTTNNERWEAEFDKKWRSNDFDSDFSDIVSVEKVKRFIKQVESTTLQKEKDRILNILKRVHGEQFSDEVHCTCLAYAIDALEGKSDESKENLKRLENNE